MTEKIPQINDVAVEIVPEVQLPQLFAAASVLTIYRQPGVIEQGRVISRDNFNFNRDVGITLLNRVSKI